MKEKKQKSREILLYLFISKSESSILLSAIFDARKTERCREPQSGCVCVYKAHKQHKHTYLYNFLKLCNIEFNSNMIICGQILLMSIPIRPLIHPSQHLFHCAVHLVRYLKRQKGKNEIKRRKRRIQWIMRLFKCKVQMLKSGFLQSSLASHISNRR